MNRFKPLAAVTGTVLALLASSFGVAAASAGPAKFVIHHSVPYRNLTIKITDTEGTLWGKVAVKPIGKTCAKATCTFRVKSGTKLTLTETPTDSSTWPFSHWVKNNTTSGTTNKLSFKITKNSTVSAVYVDSGGTTGGKLTVNITNTGVTWGTVSIPTVGTCSQTQCVFNNVPLGESLTLTETPTNSGTWPFSGWTLNGSDAGTATTLTFTMASTDTVDANYAPAS